ncbi:MAG TPA: hypothetical protein VFK16_12295 [Gemmatimonadaceae bacterium]|nr:hypothetical protein [Gemmatimonadaceae bacterium]
MLDMDLGGKMDAARRLANGQLLTFEKIYPLDAAFGTCGDLPGALRTCNTRPVS